MKGVVPDEEFPAPCDSVPASHDDVPVPAEESSAPGGSVPASDHGVPVPDQESSILLTTFPPTEDCPRSRVVCLDLR